MQKFRIILCVTVHFLLCILLNLRAISEYKPPGVVEGRFIGGFCVTSFFCLLGGGGLIFGGAYTWRSLFSEFYGMSLFNKAVLSKYDLSDRRGLFQR